MVIALLIALWGQAAQDGAGPVSQLLEALRADSPAERDRATRALQRLGPEALADLERASRDPDPEVASRASLAVRVVHLRKSLSAGLLERFPGLIDRLVDGGPGAATAEFLELAQSPAPRREDLELLATAAWAGAAEAEEKLRLLNAFFRFSLASPVLELVDALDDPEPQVRSAARGAISSAASGSPGYLLLSSSSSEDDVLDAAAVALGRLKDPALLPKLRARLAGPDPVRKRLAIHALARREGARARPEIVPLAGDPDREVRREVLRALGLMGTPADGPIVLAGLSEPDRAVRVAAIEAAGALRLDSAVPQLLPYLDDGADGDFPRVALQALSRIRAPAAIPGIARLVNSPRDALSLAAVQALGGFEPGAVTPALLELLGSGERPPRVRVIELLADLGVAEAAPAIALRLGAGEPAELRTAAVLALGRLGGPAEQERLERLLDDPSAELRALAGRALAQQGVEGVLPHLVRSLDAADPQARYHAVRGLTLLNAAGQGGRLLSLALDRKTPTWLALTTLEALEKLGTSDEVARLEPLLDDGRFDLRMAAAQVLASHGLRSGLRPLLSECRDLRSLNGLRQPRAWTWLRTRPVREDLRGSRKEIIERIFADLGTPVAWRLPGGTELDLEVPAVLSSGHGRKTHLEALREFLPPGAEFVLEDGRVTFLSREEAEGDWRAWASASR